MEANHNLVKIDPDFEKHYPGASPIATEAAMNLVRTADLLVKRISDLVQQEKGRTWIAWNNSGW